MRSPSALAVSILVVGATALYLQVKGFEQDHPLAEDAAAPGFALLALTAPHDTLRLSSYRGQVVVVEAWQRSCDNCKASMPALESVGHEYESRGLRVLHVALEQLADSAAVREFAAALGVPGADIGVDDDGAFREAYAVAGIPVTYVIDRRGRLRWQGYGVSSSADHVLAQPKGRQLLDRLVAETYP